MMGYAGGMGGAGWILMGLFWIALIVFIAWMVVSVIAQARSLSSAGSSRQPTADSTTDILDRRLATGDIDVATYNELRTALARTR